MKKLISLMCALLMVVSLVGCQSTVDQNQDAIIAERFPVDLDEVLDNAYLEDRNKIKKYSFEKEDILEQSIIYNEQYDEFHIVIILNDELTRTSSERVNDFYYRNPTSLGIFYECYERALIDYLRNNNIDEYVYLDVYSESGEYKNTNHAVYY